MKKGITMIGESEPNRIATPTSIVISPRYIGFLVNLKAPLVTSTVALTPGRGGVPNRLKRVPLPKLSMNPRTINTIPKYLPGNCSQW